MELLDIERELKGPDRRAAVEKYDRTLVALVDRCRAAMDAGLSPGDFQRCEELVDAAVVARKLIRLQARD